MPLSVGEIKERLVRVIDENGTVKDMSVAAEAISLLEKISVTKEDLERTRLGLYVNNIRKAATDRPLAKRAKNLVKTWRQMIEQGTPQRQLVPQQRLRPETPNSVGSSPSPPEPMEYGGRGYVTPRPNTMHTSPTPRAGTPTSVSAGKKSKRHIDGLSKSSKGNKKKLKSPASNGCTSSIDSSEVKRSHDKQHADPMQHLMSVGTNGLKLTFKMQPGAQVVANNNEEEEIDVVVSDGNQQWRRDMLEQTQSQTRGVLPQTQKDGRKKHKKKKAHKSPHKSSTPSPVTPVRDPSGAPDRQMHRSHEDMYNNNKNEPKLITSHSVPNFSVSKQPTTKIKSPENTKLANHVMVMSKSNSDLKKKLENASPSLKRKREQSMVNDVKLDSPSASHGDRPRSTKERRLTLTYDPLTGQLQQKQSEKEEESSTVNKETKKSPEKPRTVKKEFVKSELNDNRVSAEDTIIGKEKLKKESAIDVVIPQKQPSQTLEITEKPGADELPTGLVPTVSITRESPDASGVKCTGKCSTNSYKTRREFRKRKTRRKDGSVELVSLFPVSNLVVMTLSESDSSDNESHFCSTMKSGNKPDVEAPALHSGYCEWSGVTGCRGNNGNWYDWMETFCVRTHDRMSEQLPDGEEALPLHILPYVELD